MSREEFLNSLLFAINEIRADDIFKIIENNPDFKRVLNEIKEIDVKGFDVIKAVYKIVSLVNNITYIEGFKDGFNFFNDILKEKTNIICYNCSGGLIGDSCPVCEGKGFVKVNNYVSLIKQFIKNGDI